MSSKPSKIPSYHRKTNYRKSAVPKQECNICFESVFYNHDNVIKCNKSIHVICTNCKDKIIESSVKCPMCRSHDILKPSKTEYLKLSTTKEKIGKKMLAPKEKKKIRHSKLRKQFPGKYNQYKKNKKVYFWKDDNRFYYESWFGSNGEYVSRIDPALHNMINNPSFYENLCSIQMFGTSPEDIITFHTETGIIYDDSTFGEPQPTDLTLEDLGLDIDEILDEIDEFYQ